MVGKPPPAPAGKPGKYFGLVLLFTGAPALYPWPLNKGSQATAIVLTVEGTVIVAGPEGSVHLELRAVSLFNVDFEGVGVGIRALEGL